MISRKFSVDCIPSKTWSEWTACCHGIQKRHRNPSVKKRNNGRCNIVPETRTCQDEKCHTRAPVQAIMAPAFNTDDDDDEEEEQTTESSTSGSQGAPSSDNRSTYPYSDMLLLNLTS